MKRAKTIPSKTSCQLKIIKQYYNVSKLKVPLKSLVSHFNKKEC